ncbi:uncharacterized protein LOC125088585 [Lutra lutra]|uniref:uncharacterized protein LOC125088585 n=1 Tax=Lutra lutra TaxID=9657 RepID=UPI001FD33E0B|nr:uncharacterized protein LOC125088585 [Lutra lutra]
MDRRRPAASGKAPTDPGLLDSCLQVHPFLRQPCCELNPGPPCVRPTLPEQGRPREATEGVNETAELCVSRSWRPEGPDEGHQSFDLGLTRLRGSSSSLDYVCEDPISRQGHIPRHQGLGRGHKTTHVVAKVRTRQDHSRLRKKLLTWQLPTASRICTRKLRPAAPSPCGGRPPQTPTLRPTHTGSSGPLGDIPKETMTPEDIRPTRQERPITTTMRFRPWNPGLYNFSVWAERSNMASSAQGLLESTAPSPVTITSCMSTSGGHGVVLTWSCPQGGYEAFELQVGGQQDSQNRSSCRKRVSVWGLWPAQSYPAIVTTSGME